MKLRQSTPDDFDAIAAAINAAAQRYRNVIPNDCWHEPYMSDQALADEIHHGVDFWVIETDGTLRAVMGIQDKDAVVLIRHAYTSPLHQGHGFGTRLLHHLQLMDARPFLIGTWAAASWAIAFYQKHGFKLVSHEQKEQLLRQYWTVPERQIATSVVLADASWFEAGGNA